MLSQRAVNEGGEGWTLPLDLLLNSSSMVPCSAGDEIKNSRRGKEKAYIASYVYMYQQKVHVNVTTMFARRC